MLLRLHLERQKFVIFNEQFNIDVNKRSDRVKKKNRTLSRVRLCRLQSRLPFPVAKDMPWELQLVMFVTTSTAATTVTSVAVELIWQRSHHTYPTISLSVCLFVLMSCHDAAKSCYEFFHKFLASFKFEQFFLILVSPSMFILFDASSMLPLRFSSLLLSSLLPFHFIPSNAYHHPNFFRQHLITAVTLVCLHRFVVNIFASILPSFPFIWCCFVNM